MSIMSLGAGEGEGWGKVGAGRHIWGLGWGRGWGYAAGAGNTMGRQEG